MCETRRIEHHYIQQLGRTTRKRVAPLLNWAPILTRFAVKAPQHCVLQHKKDIGPSARFYFRLVEFSNEFLESCFLKK